MTGGYAVCTELLSELQKSLKFDFPITENIWIWSAPGKVFIKEMAKYITPVFARKIGSLKRNLEFLTDCFSVGKVFGGATVLIVVVAFPVFHEQAGDLMTLLFE